MRHRSLLAASAASMACCASPLAHAFTITPTFVNSTAQTWNSTEIAVVNEAISDWTSILSYTGSPQNINMTFQFTSAGINNTGTNTGYLGLWTGSYSAPAGSTVTPWYPGVTHIVYINTDWMTPPTGDPALTFTTGSPGPASSTVPSTTYDALSVLRHELGHALGLNPLYGSNVGLANATLTLASDITFTGPTGAIFDDTPGGLNIPLAAADNYQHVADNNDLMSISLTNGLRKGISFTDIEELSLAYGYAVTIPAGLTYPTTTFKTQTITLNGTVAVASTTGARNTPAVVLSSQNLTINPGGLLDLSNHDLILRGGQTVASVRALIASGQGTGTWNGTTGITSSTANAAGTTFGFATAGALNVSTFDGLAVNPTDLLVKYTYLGDATLDGKVDLSDLNIVLNNLGTTNPNWCSGNFDGAATIDLTDLNDVLNHLGLTIPTGSSLLADAPTPSTVPEPASLSLLALVLPALGRRRRKF